MSRPIPLLQTNWNPYFFPSYLCFMLAGPHISDWNRPQDASLRPCHIHIIYQWAWDPLSRSKVAHRRWKRAQLTWEVADVTQNKEISVWSRKASASTSTSPKSAWERLHHRSRGLLYPASITLGFSSLSPCLTQLQNLNSASVWSRAFEIQLCWQSCIRLGLRCTSTLSHVAAHQQSVSLRCYTFFFSLPFFFFFYAAHRPTLAALWRKSKKSQQNNKAVPQYIWNQTSGSGRISIRWPHASLWEYTHTHTACLSIMMRICFRNMIIVHFFPPLNICKLDIFCMFGFQLSCHRTHPAGNKSTMKRRSQHCLSEHLSSAFAPIQQKEMICLYLLL